MTSGTKGIGNILDDGMRDPDIKLHCFWYIVSKNRIQELFSVPLEVVLRPWCLRSLSILIQRVYCLLADHLKKKHNTQLSSLAPGLLCGCHRGNHQIQETVKAVLP